MITADERLLEQARRTIESQIKLIDSLRAQLAEAQAKVEELSVGHILTDKELMSAVITAVMSGKQADRDEACRKLQYHIMAVETERDAREAECERKSEMYEQQVEYSIKLQRLIEAFCRDDSELPYPRLHHHELLMRRRAALSPPKELP